MEFKYIDKVIKTRHFIHQHPELSGEEIKTSQYLEKLFNDLKKSSIIHLDKTGLLIKFKSRRSVKKLLLRAELDALPIKEINNHVYSSRNEGRSHACGHDGHMAMLYGIGLWCNDREFNNLDVYLLYQPAEETGSGAREILDKGLLPFHPDFCFAIHNVPGYDDGSILLRENYFSAAVISLEIQLTGKTSHAAEPEHGINPALAIAEITRQFDKLNNNHPELEDFFISTPVFIQMGEPTYGTGAGEGRLGFTFRCWNNDLLNNRKSEAVDFLIKTAKNYKLEAKYWWKDEFRSNYNKPEAVKVVRRAAEHKNLKTQDLELPFKWGEDFGSFTSRFTGTMIGLGSGTSHSALHNPDFDFPDQVMEKGILIYQGIIETLDKDGA